MLRPIHPVRRTTRKAAKVRVQREALLPAPVRGLDTSLPFSDQDPRTANVLTNIICRRAGCELRGGAKRHTSNLGDIGTESPVGSLAAYHPPAGPGSTQTKKLFAFCENEKVYDVTDQASEATELVSVLTASGQISPGIISHINFANAAANYLLVAIPGVGYFTYDHIGGWVDRTASVTGVSLTNVAFVTVWKKRIWFILENDTSAWYLPANAITGAATEFDFGPELANGGELRILASWTLDSGSGIDDKLVAIGSQGDVLVYAGTDPAGASTFGLTGRWYVGPVAYGRKFATKYGGDLGIICENGIEFMSRLVNAQGLLDPDGEQVNTATRRYNENIAKDVRSTRGEHGWSAIHTSSEDCVVVTTPHYVTGETLQYCFSTVPAAWSIFTGLQAKCAEFFNGDLYIGTPDGTIQKMFASDTDDELTDGTVGASVLAFVQTAFVAPNDDRMNLKRPLLAMPMLTALESPSLFVRVNTEWSSAAPAGTPSFIPDENAVWDTALWDDAVWGGADNTYLLWIGCEGLGCFVSLSLAFTGKPRTTFTSWKLLYEAGGVM